MVSFLFGCIVTACAIIGLFFFRFWWRRRDRLFICFATTFWLLGLDWLILACVKPDEPQSPLYLVRLLAFIVLLAGIWDKNRSRNNGVDS
ncbi:MAG TPA: DUF5985 family protein [Tepidisphaeraceae bacterium]|jgi:hypothetical protein|nr:DUF5985 family protein [Tepidisphaeraceae bacterium]